MKKLISSLLALALSLSLAAVPAAALTLEDAKQLDEARQLIRQYCPKAGRLFEKE